MGDGEGQGEGQGASSGEGQGEGVVTRAEFEGLAGKVDKVLGLLEGKGKAEGDGQGEAEPAGKSIAEQVREGIAELEAKKEAEAKAKGEADQRADHEARLKALEEKPPAEPDSMVSKLRRRLYGQEPDGNATPRPVRARQGAAQS